MTIEVYAFEGADGEEHDWTTQDYGEAKAYAQQHRLALIARQFDYTDSELVEDYRPKTRRRRKAAR
jgi:hypothetical protein